MSSGGIATPALAVFGCWLVTLWLLQQAMRQSRFMGSLLARALVFSACAVGYMSPIAQLWADLSGPHGELRRGSLLALNKYMWSAIAFQFVLTTFNWLFWSNELEIAGRANVSFGQFLVRVCTLRKDWPAPAGSRPWPQRLGLAAAKLVGITLFSRFINPSDGIADNPSLVWELRLFCLVGGIMVSLGLDSGFEFGLFGWHLLGAGTARQMFGQPLFSTSLRQFWNDWHQFLKDTYSTFTFSPLQRLTSNRSIIYSLGGLGVFALSGVMHEVVYYLTFGFTTGAEGTGGGMNQYLPVVLQPYHNLAFFLCHGTGMMFQEFVLTEKSMVLGQLYKRGLIPQQLLKAINVAFLWLVHVQCGPLFVVPYLRVNFHRML